MGVGEGVKLFCRREQLVSECGWKKDLKHSVGVGY